MSSWNQKEILIYSEKRGFLLITEEIANQVPEISNYKIGLLYLFLKHTSASLTINENADSTVREDLEMYFNKFVPEKAPYYMHTFEGPDDMPAHIKSVTIGSNLMIPITSGRLNLGAWQGIYLCEHRNNSPKRSIVLTISY